MTGLGVALMLFAGCTAEVEQDSCPTANNGVCEELAGCPLGTDSTDCDAACPDDQLVACAHDQAANPGSLPDTSWGTGGSGGPVGTWDGLVTVRGANKSDQVDRHFRVYVPRRYDPRTPTPVLFVLGGFGVDMYWLAEYTELNRTADLNNFIVVYGHPEWRDFGSYWVFSWYVYDNAWEGAWSGNPDLAYLEAVSDEVRQLYNVDRTRTFVSGHSRGGSMSVIAAFEKPDLFAGFCAQAGFADFNNYDTQMEKRAPERPFAAYLLHGADDPDVPVAASDTIAEIMLAEGWVEGDTLIYNRLPAVTHRWQPQYNEQVWEFLSAHPLPLDEAAR